MDFKKRREALIAETKEKISKGVKGDFLITQSVNSIGEIDKVVNTLSKRLREWYGLYNPELSRAFQDHETFIDELLKDVKRKENTMGGSFSQLDLDSMYNFAGCIKSLYLQKETQTEYIKKLMIEFCPNLLSLTGPVIGAKLLAQKGTLKELAFMPSSTIQLLGAEKALFRHLKTNARTPKYGYLLQHQLVSQAKNKGRAARQLAGKISIAVKKDYFGKEENR